jgi:putative hydrolase of the HAD superfamily
MTSATRPSAPPRLARAPAPPHNARPMTPRLVDQALLCDADDTLWENNVYFLDALVAFLDLAEAAGAVRLAAEKTLREVEAARTKSHGYGSRNFAASLVESWRRLFGAPPAAIVARLEALGEIIFTHPIEVLPGVGETLAELGKRHALYVVTKGDPDEQRSKIERSGLAAHFRGAEILREKDEAGYRELVAKHGLDPATTWMIGNSPKSDMNPAIQAGLRTVFVPHRTIWEFEKAELIRPPDLVCARFDELLTAF